MAENNPELSQAKQKLAEMKNILSALTFRHKDQLRKLDEKFKKSIAKYEKEIKEQSQKVKELSERE